MPLRETLGNSMKSTMEVNWQNLVNLKAALDSNALSGTFLPSVFVLELTNRCNINCIMCPNKKFVQSELGDISDEMFTRVIDEIAPVAELTMLYFLGESTLHPRFVELLKFARNRLRGRIVLSTNAFQLPDEIVKCLVECTDIVLICVDRWQKAEYEKVRKGSSFENVVEAARRVLSERGNKKSPIVLVKALDIKFRTDTVKELIAERDAFSSYWIQHGAIPLVGWLNTWAGQLPNLGNLSTFANPYSMESRPACADLWFKAVINWRGEVVLCCHDWRSTVIVGNLRDEDLQTAWHSPKLVEFRANHVRGNFSCAKLCRDCKEWGGADELESYVRLNSEDIYKVF